VALALSAVALPLAVFGGSAAQAQSIMRTPSLHIDSRITTINPTVAPRVNPTIGTRINPTITGRANVGVTTVARMPPIRSDGGSTSIMRIPDSRIGILRIGVEKLPYARYSHNLYPVCEYANRGPDGECFDRPILSTGGGSNGASGKNRNGRSRNNATPQAAINLNTVRNELVAEIDGALSLAQADELARRHGLQRVASQEFPLLGSTVGLFRIIGQRPSETVRREFAADGSVKSVQLNFRYLLQDQKRTQTEGDVAQYAVAQLRLPQAHALARGMNVTIAVVDSGIDVRHPELANSVADAFDALGSKEGPHVHGTGVAGAIVAHAKLMGSAPEARLLAIRAFGAGANGAESTSYVILKALNYAAEHGAQIINMSFAGPKDPLV